MSLTVKKPGNEGLTNPLASLVAKAAGALPAQTGATEKARADRLRPELTLVLADVSPSMGEAAGPKMRRVDYLAQALTGVQFDHIIAFEGRYFECTVATLPSPGGSGTALHLPLADPLARQATRIVVISDGQPDDAMKALIAADKLRCRIDCVHCGLDTDFIGINFLSQLSRSGGFSQHVAPNSLPRQMKTLLLSK